METVVREHAGHSRYLIDTNDIQFPSLNKKVQEDYQAICDSFNNYKNTIGEIQRELQNLISGIEGEYFSKSYQLYEQFLSKDSAEYVLGRQLMLTNEATDYLHSRMKSYGNWKHSALMIRPGKEDWIQNLVACDPLYLVDLEMDLLEPVMSRFNPDYQRRLRPYLIRDDSDKILGSIPDGQIGFCLVYYFFNFKPFEVVRSYLEEIHQKLKPGGSLAFTFNNCDRSGAIELVEKNFMCYTPGKLLLTMCESLGYQVRHTYQLDNASTWVELTKPGTLTSLRGGQSLARIVAKSK